jgi:hypothetical protein
VGGQVFRVSHDRLPTSFWMRVPAGVQQKI